ncbi:uncharacterized protein PG998_013034 [Apiospora kogelbergensis]|uniref:uncharacterized protein n=1 Tax=Apiospora kogelbergensis TaxID=1337665 RepID=UPI00313038A9
MGTVESDGDDLEIGTEITTLLTLNWMGYPKAQANISTLDVASISNMSEALFFYQIGDDVPRAGSWDGNQPLQAPVPTEARPFDINLALALLECRPRPQIDPGLTHFLLPFVVTDASDPLDRIIFASDSFLNLTGYMPDEVLGSNCRFLQAPDGIVAPGCPRQFVSSESAYIFKEKVHGRRETEHSIINFKKSGEAFLNNVAIVPIAWETPGVPRFIFGFSNFFELAPSATSFRPSLDAPAFPISSEMQSSLASRPSWAPTPSAEWPDFTLNQHVDETVLEFEPTNANPVDKPNDAGADGLKDLNDPPDLLCCRQGLEDVDLDALPSVAPFWNQMLLDNLDALVQVMSLKGMIVYASASHEKLGYGAGDLIGKHVDTVYHPSDVAVLMREFKKASVLDLDLTVRLKQKSGQYIWFQSTGSAQIDGGRRWVTITLLQQPIARLSSRTLRNDDERSTKHSFWLKLSMSGLILHLFTDPQKLLGLTADDLIGTMFQDLLKLREARFEFEQLLGGVRGNSAASSNLTLISGRGHRIATSLVLHPGPMGDRQRPYYVLVHCSILRPPARTRKASSCGGTDRRFGISSPPSTPLPGEGGDYDVLEGLDADRCGPLGYEIHRQRLANRNLRDELETLQKRATLRRRFRRHGGDPSLGCANCHTKDSPEWRRGPGGVRNLCNRCGLRWAKTRRDLDARNKHSSPSLAGRSASTIATPVSIEAPL